MEGCKFRRQHPVGKFILDFYCEVLRLAIEVDGGGHSEPGQVEYDRFRTRVLNQQGIRVVRFWNDEVLGRTEDVLEEIKRVVKERVNRPSD